MSVAWVIVGVSQAVAFFSAVHGGVCAPLFHLQSAVPVAGDLVLSAVVLDFVSSACGQFGQNPHALAST